MTIPLFNKINQRFFCFFYQDFSDEKNIGEKKILGIIQLSFAYLFEQIKLKKDRGVYYVVTASYLEVYNEQVTDFLVKSIRRGNQSTIN